jgi:hypothetical protein
MACFVVEDLPISETAPTGKHTHPPRNEIVSGCLNISRNFARVFAWPILILRVSTRRAFIGHRVAISRSLPCGGPPACERHQFHRVNLPSMRAIVLLYPIVLRCAQRVCRAARTSFATVSSSSCVTKMPRSYPAAGLMVRWISFSNGHPIMLHAL